MQSPGARKRSVFPANRLLFFGFGNVRGCLGDLALMPGMPSEVTLRKLIIERPDFPIISRGKNGVAYEIELIDAFAFVRGIEDEKQRAASVKADALRQLGLELLGADAASADAPMAMSSADRRALMEEELVAIKLAEKRGSLVRKDQVIAAVSDFVMMVAERQKTLVDRLAKLADLPRDALTALDRLIEHDRRDVADRMEQIRDAAPADTNADPVL